MPSLTALSRIMANKVVIDGRNIYDAEDMRENGFVYYKIG